MSLTYKILFNGKAYGEYYGLTKTEFEPGETVRFTVPFVTDVNTYVSSRECYIYRLGTENSKTTYEFMMPYMDVNVSITTGGSMTNTNSPVFMGMGMAGAGMAADPSMIGMMGMMGMMNAMQKPYVPEEKPCEKIICPACGSSVENKKFCAECGVSLIK